MRAALFVACHLLVVGCHGTTSTSAHTVDSEGARVSLKSVEPTDVRTTHNKAPLTSAGDRPAAAEVSKDRKSTSNDFSAASVVAQQTQRPWLGFSLESERQADSPLIVSDVHPKSAAFSAGLLKGDQIIELEGQSLTSARQLRASLSRFKAGDTLSLRVERATAFKGAQTLLLELLVEDKPSDEVLLRKRLLGSQAPELAGAITYQGEISSLREARGSVVLLDFWASYCAGCLASFDKLEALSRHFGPMGLRVVGLTTDSTRRGRQIAREHGLSYTLMSDPKAQVLERYFISAIPSIILIDHQGTIQEIVVGSEPNQIELLRKGVEELLQKRASAQREASL